MTSWKCPWGVKSWHCSQRNKGLASAPVIRTIKRGDGKRKSQSGVTLFLWFCRASHFMTWKRRGWIFRFCFIRTLFWRQTPTRKDVLTDCVFTDRINSMFSMNFFLSLIPSLSRQTWESLFHLLCNYFTCICHTLEEGNKTIFPWEISFQQKEFKKKKERRQK